jgi:hypothetical protein
MKTTIFYADGVTQSGRRILVSAGRGRRFALTETKDPHTGQPIRCVIELRGEGGEDEWLRRRNLQRRVAMENPLSPPTEVLAHPYI